MVRAAAVKLEELFDTLQIDHGPTTTRRTRRAVAKMYVEELLAGRYSAPPPSRNSTTSEFRPSHRDGPIDLRSTCAHHLMPIHGEVFVGVLPAANGRIIGLSKYNRIVEHFASRLQIQKELVKQIGEYLFQKTAPRGLAVRASAVHMCRTQQGGRASRRSRMVTTCYFGSLLENQALKQEFRRGECAALERSS
jgi:GTP cyclohydrolase I